MIRIDKKNALPSGAVAVYAQYTPHIGETISVMYGDQEGSAIVAKTTLVLWGKLSLILLDVDWTSFN